jgi:hypothetical protein
MSKEFTTEAATTFREIAKTFSGVGEADLGAITFQIATSILLGNTKELADAMEAVNRKHVDDVLQKLADTAILSSELLSDI